MSRPAKAVLIFWLSVAGFIALGCFAWQVLAALIAIVAAIAVVWGASMAVYETFE